MTLLPLKPALTIIGISQEKISILPKYANLLIFSSFISSSYTHQLQWFCVTGLENWKCFTNNWKVWCSFVLSLLLCNHTLLLLHLQLFLTLFLPPMPRETSVHYMFLLHLPSQQHYPTLLTQDCQCKRQTSCDASVFHCRDGVFREMSTQHFECFSANIIWPKSSALVSSGQKFPVTWTTCGTNNPFSRLSLNNVFLLSTFAKPAINNCPINKFSCGSFLIWLIKRCFKYLTSLSCKLWSLVVMFFISLWQTSEVFTKPQHLYCN